MHMKTVILFFLIAGLLLPVSLIAQQGDEEHIGPRDSFYQRETVPDRNAIDLPHVREADVLWSKRVWQVIDLREKINQPLYYPVEEIGQYRSLMKVIEEAVRAGELTVYNRNDNDLSGAPLNPENAFDSWDSEIEDEDGEIHYELFRTHEVYRYQIMEEWFIDRRRSVMDVRIIAVLPIRMYFDEVLQETVFEGVFWIPFDELRQVMANAQVYNRHNDAHTMTFDDIFIRRMFSSRIIREFRPDGRMIMDYPGFEDITQQLIEGRRIKEEIRNRELDMWHY